MAALPRTTFATAFLEWKLSYFDSTFTEICSHSAVNNMPALVKIIPWRCTGIKPLPKPTMAWPR